MVWKKSKSKKADKRSAKKLKTVPEERLKSCLKKQQPREAAASDSSSHDGSHSQRCSADEQSSTKSLTTHSLASTNGSRSVDSKGSASSSMIRRRAQSGEQMSCGTSESSVDNTQSPQNSERSAQLGPHAEGKKVRFNACHIRQYERTVGDHPCCSTGPPLSIGWKYGKTVVVDVNTFERAKMHRKASGLIVTRHERESLLLEEWGVPTHKIAGGTRSALKTKNQRKQTITNLGKMSRIEEAMEAASKRLKRALMLRRSTGNEVKRLQEQANLAAEALASLSKIRRERSALGGNSTTFSQLEMERFYRELELEMFGDEELLTMGGNSTTFSQLEMFYRELELEMFGDEAYTLGATTLGNKSASPSMTEMEKFYQELELEMFGDEELPSMVGQTLEVPAKIRASGQDSVVGETSSVFNLDDSLNSGIPPSTSDLIGRFKDGMSVSVISGADPSSRSESKDETSSDAIDAALEEEQNRSMISQSLLEGDDSVMAKLDTSREQEDQDALYRHYPLERMHLVHGDYCPSRYHAATSRLSSSLDSADPDRARVTESVVALEYQFMQPQQPLVPLHTGMSMFQGCALLGGHDKNGSYPSHSHGKRRSSRSDSNAGPKVQHVPPPTHLSPSHWMEDADSPPVEFGQDYQTITISEDSVQQQHQQQQHSQGYYYDSGYNGVRPTYVAAQQFPSSFY